MQGIEVITDQLSIIDTITRFQAGIKKIWCACVEKSLPAFSVGKVKQGYLEAKTRGVKMRYITEITKDNLRYCREIMKFAELRHLDRVSCNFAVSETEYISGIMRKGTLVSLVITDVEEMVSQQRLVFQTLWNISMPAADRIARLR